MKKTIDTDKLTIELVDGCPTEDAINMVFGELSGHIASGLCDINLQESLMKGLHQAVGNYVKIMGECPDPKVWDQLVHMMELTREVVRIGEAEIALG